MLENLTISKHLKLAKSEDYYLLRKEGLKKIEELAHELWTDYNIEDPGVTKLEVLCYAITDLGYRTSYQVKDILTKEEKSERKIQGNFYTALEILPNHPVTFNDLRKLLIDINGVRNAWISKNESIKYCLDTFHKKLKDCNGSVTDQLLDPLNGIYDVLIEYEDYVAEDDRIVKLGRAERGSDPGTYMTAGARGINFRVRHPLTIQSVSVYPETAPGDVTVRLLEGDETDVYSVIQETTQSVTTADTLTEIPLNFEIQPGKKYRLDANGSTVKLYRNANFDYPEERDLLITLLSGWSGTTEDSSYYFFYDWKITYSISPVELELALSDELINNSMGMSEPLPTGGAYIQTTDKGLVFDVISPVVIHTVQVVPEVAGTLNLQIYDDTDTLFDEFEANLTKPGEVNEVSLEVELPTGTNYKMKAVGTSIRLYRNNNVDFLFEVKNVLEIKNGFPTTNIYYFFYNWQISHRFPVVQTTELTRSDIHLAVKERLYRYRNLCEDFCKIRDLELEDIAVCSDIELTPEADIHETLAEIFYQLELHVSPPVNFYSIKELKDRGYTTDQIFEGPILDHGFIDNEEFRKIERRKNIRTSDVIQIIMDVPGVKAVKEIKLISYTEVTPENPVQPGDDTVFIHGIQYIIKEDDWILELEDPGKMAPNFNPELSKIIFYKNGLPYYANMQKVMELYNEKRFHSGGVKLRGHERDLPIPIGEDKALEDYYPIQNDLPANYMVGQYRVPRAETEMRKAQSRQLKGYLLFFEQILANYLSQLVNVKELFSWENTEIKTYFTQTVKEFSNWEDIYELDEIDHIIQLNEIIETKEIANERRNRFLDHLLSRFAESFSEYGALMYSVYKQNAAEKLIKDKQDFLANYPQISSGRGKGFDYRYPEDPNNMSGMTRRISYLLGFDKVQRGPLASSRIQPAFLELGDGDCAAESWRFEITNEEGDEVIFKSICCQNKDLICVLIDSTIELGADEENYQLNETEGYWELINRCDDEITVIGTLANDHPALKDELIEFFKTQYTVEGMQVIEHILLRKRSTGEAFLPVQINEDPDDCQCPEVMDPYSFRISVILPSWSERFQHIRFRQFVEKTIRMETPAHVYPRICWINYCQMMELQEVHEKWLSEHSQVALQFKGCLPLPDITSPDLTEKEKDMLASYEEAQKNLIEKLYKLNNVFPTARLHDCDEVDGDNPQITLNETNLGTL